MDDDKRLARNGLAYTLGGALQLIVTLLVLPVLTRVLEPETFGLVVTLQLVTQVVVLIGTAGIPSAISREYFGGESGPRRASQLVNNVVLAAGATTLVGVVGAIAWIQVFGSDWPTMAILLAVGTGWPRASTVAGLGYLRSRQRVKSFLGISIVNTVGAQAAGVAAALIGSRTATDFLLGYLLGSFAAAAWAWGLAGRALTVLRGSDLRRVLGYALPIVPAALATLLLQLGDRFVVSSVLGLEEVGRYQVAYVLATLGVPTLVAFNNAWGPRLSLAAEQGTFETVLRKEADSVLSGIAAIGAVASLGAPVVISLGLPADYDAAALRPVIAIVAASTVWFAAYSIATQVLVVARRTTTLAVVTPIAAAVNIALNLLLVSEIGLRGAALATSVAYFGLAISVTRSARRLMPYRYSPLGLATAGVVNAIGLLTILLPVGGVVATGARIVLSVLALAMPVFGHRRGWLH